MLKCAKSHPEKPVFFQAVTCRRFPHEPLRPVSVQQLMLGHSKHSLGFTRIGRGGTDGDIFFLALQKGLRLAGIVGR
jgi:hypothetical protein